MDIKLNVPASVIIRTRDMVDDYFAAPQGTNVEVAVGAANGRPAVLVSIGSRRHGFFAVEARAVALGLEGAMNKYPDTQEARAVPNLILALRAGADSAIELEEHYEDHRGDEAGEGEQGKDRGPAGQDRPLLRQS